MKSKGVVFEETICLFKQALPNDVEQYLEHVIAPHHMNLIKK